MRILRRLRRLSGRPCSLAIRAALFVVYAAALTYLDAANLKTVSALNPATDVSYRTINAGHPFYIYRGEASDLDQPGKADSTKFVPYFQWMINDTGLPMSLSALRLCFDAFGIFRGYQFNDFELPFFAYIAMLVFGATLILPTLPFVVALLAYVPLIEVTLDFSDNLVRDPRTVEAFGLAILGVYALVLVFSRWKRGSIVFIVTTTLFVAWLNLSRQGLISQKLLLDAMLMAYFGLSALSRRFRRSGYRRKPAAVQLRTALAIAVSFPVAFLYTAALSAFLSLYYGLPYSLQYIPNHGNGSSLYISAGYAANPFNIAWDDSVFQVNYMTFSDRFFTLAYPQWKAVIEPALFDEFARTVVEDPMVYVRNTVEKARLAHRYLVDATIPRIFPYDLIYNFRTAQRLTYRATLVGLVLLAALGVFAPCRWLWGSILPMLAVAAVSLMPPLLVSPGYLLSFLGAIASISFAWFGVCAAGLLCGGRLRLATRRAATRSIVVVGAGIALVLLAFSVYVGFREVYNARQDARLLRENPYDVMREKGYRFAESFNRLTLTEQKRAIRRLLTSRPGHTNVEVFCGPDRDIFLQLGPEAADLQSSLCAFILDEPWRQNFRVAMVLNYFSDKWHEVLPRRDQGPVGSQVTLGSIDPCPEEPRRKEKYWWDRPWHGREKCVYSRLANANWQGKFYINVLPVGKAFTDGADVLISSTQEIIAAPEQSQFSFVERNVGSVRLARYDGAFWRSTTTSDANTAQSLAR